jgi:hypothetical protein
MPAAAAAGMSGGGPQELLEVGLLAREAAQLDDSQPH